MHTGDSDSSMSDTSSDSEPKFGRDDMLKIPIVLDIGLSVVRSLTRESCSVKTAVRLLEEGKVIAVPTDTIYGIACDAQNTDALRKLYSIKARDKKKPLAICVGRVEDVGLWGNTSTVNPELLRDLLPGPVTVLFRRREELNKSLNPFEDKVGIRVPDHLFIQIIANELGRPLALTSANLSSEPSAVSVEELYPIRQHLGAVFDGGRLGPDRSGSTIIDLTMHGQFRVVREGQSSYETYTKLFKHGLYRFQS